MPGRRRRRIEGLPTLLLKDKPEVPVNPFGKSPMIISKNIDFADFTIEALVFHIKEYFENMGQVLAAKLVENANLNLMKDFYKNMNFNPSSSNITCLLDGKWIIITKAFL